MRIVIVAPIEEPVPPKKYGGTELVVSNCCEQMVALGHEVFLLASGDSVTSAHLIPLVPKSLRSLYPPEELSKYREVHKLHQLAIVLREIDRLQPDVVFNHQGWRLAPFLSLVDCPTFTTIHGPLTSIPEVFTYQQFPDTPLISISNNQRLAMPELHWVKTIYNGIDLSRFVSEDSTNREYFAFLGRTSPQKGLKEICQMIKRTNQRLKIAAKVDAADKNYFETEIQPLIDGKQIEFIGEIGPEEKQQFLQQAKGLLLWLNWEEPFGLVVVEAMACGTPVIVNARGAMPEIVENGKTGFLVSSIEEMQDRLEDVSSLSSEHCQTVVQERFSARRMATEYLNLI